MSRTPIILLDGATRQPVNADLVEGLTLEDIQSVDVSWTPFLRQALRDALADGLASNDLPEHAHWRWERKWHPSATGTQFLGIECKAEMQALMSVRPDKTCRLPVSRQSGYNGRIGLHSLLQAEDFYRDKCGMNDLGRDIFYEDLRYLEMTEAQSKAFTERTK